LLLTFYSAFLVTGLAVFKPMLIEDMLPFFYAVKISEGLLFSAAPAGFELVAPSQPELIVIRV
jgi:hypothetical protein